MSGPGRLVALRFPATLRCSRCGIVLRVRHGEIWLDRDTIGERGVPLVILCGECAREYEAEQNQSGANGVEADRTGVNMGEYAPKTTIRITKGGGKR